MIFRIFTIVFALLSLFCRGQQTELWLQGVDLYENAICGDIDHVGLISTAKQFGGSTTDLQLAKLDLNGVIVNSRLYDFMDDERAIHITQDATSYTVLAAVKQPLSGKSRSDEWNFIVAVIDKNSLAIVKSNKFSDPLPFTGQDCEDVIATHIVHVQGGYLISGFISAIYPGAAFNDCISRIPFVMRLNADLSIVWTKVFSNRGVEETSNWKFNVATHITLSADGTNFFVTGQDGSPNASLPVSFIGCFDANTGVNQWYRAYVVKSFKKGTTSSYFSGVKTLIDPNNNNNLVWFLRAVHVPGISGGAAGEFCIAEVSAATGNIIGSQCAVAEEIMISDADFISNNKIVVAGLDSRDNNTVFTVGWPSKQIINTSIYTTPINGAVLANSNVPDAPYLFCESNSIGEIETVNYFTHFNLQIIEDISSGAKKAAIVNSEDHNDITIAYNVFDNNAQWPSHIVAAVGDCAGPLGCQTGDCSFGNIASTIVEATDLLEVFWNFDSDPIVGNTDVCPLLYAACSHQVWKNTERQERKLTDEVKNVRVYPNPFSNNISINTKGNQIIDNVKIYNCKGQVVYLKEFDLDHTTLDLGHLSNGVYQIKISMSNGDVENHRIVK